MVTTTTTKKIKTRDPYFVDMINKKSGVHGNYKYDRRENKLETEELIEEELNDLIDEWHNSDTTEEIWEHIGMTEEEYAKFVEGE